MDIREILSSYKNQFVPSEEIEGIAKERLEVCKECPLYKKGLLKLYICDDCKCPVSKKGKPFGKTYSPKVGGGCPENKWPR